MSTSIGTIASWFSGAEIVVSINARLRAEVSRPSCRPKPSRSIAQ